MELKNLIIYFFLIVSFFCLTFYFKMNANAYNFDPYMDTVSAVLKKNWDPPRSTSPINTEVTVEFYISKEGTVENLEIVKSSGRKEIDDAAVLAVNNSAPFEKIPQESEMDNLNIRFTFKYQKSIEGLSGVSPEAGTRNSLQEMKNESVVLKEELEKIKEENLMYKSDLESVKNKQGELKDDLEKTFPMVSKTDNKINFNSESYTKELTNKLTSEWKSFSDEPLEKDNVQVEFRVGIDGKVIDTNVIGSSGNEKIDNSIISSIYKMEPYPVLPSDSNLDSIKIIHTFPLKSGNTFKSIPILIPIPAML